jgi:hypothetical protein
MSHTPIPSACRLRARLVPALLVGFLTCSRLLSAEDDSGAGGASDAAEARQVIQQAIEQADRRPGPPALQAGRGIAALSAANPDEPEGLRTARISAEVAARQLEAKRLAQKSPADALALLDDLDAGLAAQPLADDARSQLLRRIERTRIEIEGATGKRRAELAMPRSNPRSTVSGPSGSKSTSGSSCWWRNTTR